MDLNLPKYSYEERVEMSKNIKEGDKLARVWYNRYYDSYSVLFLKVERITPTGKIRLSNNDLLNYLSDEYYILTDEIREEIELYVEFCKSETKLRNIIEDIYKWRLIPKADTIEEIQKVIYLLENSFKKKHCSIQNGNRV